MKYTIRDYIKLYQTFKPSLKESASEMVKIIGLSAIPAAATLGLAALIASMPTIIEPRWTSRTDGHTTIVEKIGTFVSPVRIVDYDGDGVADEKIAGRYRIRASKFDQEIYESVLNNN